MSDQNIDAPQYGGEPVTLPVQNLGQFAQLLTDWFNDCRAQVDHASLVPEDVNIRATIDGEERVLTPQERQAFVLGLQMTAAIFEKLPFETVPEPEDEANG
jgi:hypothetical protein